MTAQIANTINDVLKPQGVGVIIKATHHCMTTRRAQARRRSGHQPDAGVLPRQRADPPGIPRHGGLMQSATSEGEEHGGKES